MIWFFIKISRKFVAKRPIDNWSVNICPNGLASRKKVICLPVSMMYHITGAYMRQFSDVLQIGTGYRKRICYQWRIQKS